jgi:hypothetical protein
MTQRHRISPRALIIGLIGAAAACFVVAWAELVVASIQIAICQFAPAAIGLLLIVVLVNAGVRAVTRRIGLQAHEVIVVYVMILVAALTCSRGLLERWLPALVAVNYYTNESNHWQTTFYPHIPQWAVPFDVKGGGQQPIVKSFYEGIRPGQPIPWRPWAGPIAAWLVVVLALLFAYACLAAILRKQWVDNEKLTFPLVYLPLEMAKDQGGTGSFFSNRLTWIGFAIPTLVFTLNGIHCIVPSVPQIPVQYPLSPAFSAMGRPWTDIGDVTAYCSLAALGFSFFLPAQLLFSLWAFFVFCRIENVVFSTFGASFEAMPLYPTSIWNGYQVAGAYAVLSAYLVKSSLPHLRTIWREATTAREDPADREFLSYRVAIFGLIVSSAVAVYWFAALGMSVWMAVVELGVYLFMVVLVMARSVSEAGMLMTETSFRPVDIVRIFTTRTALGPSTLTALSFADAAFTRDLRGNLLSTFLDGLKMSDMVKLDRRHLFYAIAIALIVAIVLGGAIQIIIPYQRGAISLYGYSYQWNAMAGFQHFQPAIDAPDKYDARLPVFFASGVGLTIFLAYMRMRYTWWPLAPLGLALSGSWSMIVFWFPIFIAWCLKSIILRYGGMKTYMNLRFFFLGLILGEFSQAVIWAAIASIWRVPAPFFPWP